ncbi:MAG TPA: hypothetical protein VKB92_07875 [Myxococcales bacterium]|nr:hypothetical protein [Myxococcales bacterium]
MAEDIEAHVIPPPPPYPIYDGPQGELFDWVKVRRYLGFSLGSIRRRPFLFLLVAAGMALLAAAGLAVLPKTYEVESRLLAQTNPVLAVRADSRPADLPTRAAAETIIRRDNLHAMIQQADLLQEWPKRRAPILRVKDWVLRALHSAPTETELTEGLTGLLEKNLTVWTTLDGTVVIQLHWPDPLLAYRLADAAQQNFLEKRHVLEVETIAEQISILEGHAATLKKNIETQVADLQQLREHTSSKAARAPAPPPPAKSVNPELPKLRVMLDAKRRSIADLEEYRRKHILELQTRLAEQRAIYAENHPMLQDLERSIDSLRVESPQLSALRQEERDLRRQLAGFSDDAAGASSSAPTIPADLFRGLGPLEDSSVEYARAQLRYAAQEYAAMRERIDHARIELDTARAAFKYRYSVVTPPQVPRGPIKPKAPLVMAAALIAGLALALFTTTFADLRAGIVLKRWQLEDLLGSSGAIVDVRLPAPPVGRLPPSESPPP